MILLQESFKSNYSFDSDQLMMILMKTADISNECRPMDVAGVWLDCLFQEYFMQVHPDTVCFRSALCRTLLVHPD